MNKIIITMAFFSSFLGLKSQNTKEVIKILNTEAFKQSIEKKDVLLYDVRTPKEFNEGTISYAKNLNFFELNKFLKSFDKIDKNQPIYLFCRSGNRSNKAARLLAKKGFTKIYDLNGGYIAWNK